MSHYSENVSNKTRATKREVQDGTLLHLLSIPRSFRAAAANVSDDIKEFITMLGGDIMRIPSGSRMGPNGELR